MADTANLKIELDKKLFKENTRLKEELRIEKVYVNDLKKQLSGARSAITEFKRLLKERSNKKPKLVTTEKEINHG